ncbi:putative LRR receptor-like serine/threonine-protein kinase [Iris pallida]|uniref:LRR receptor-like serine/threonine-protein kinase n=1 Tax=Iris pallida TaxID=29817 RepID=A0AAX6FPS5_IRIPA|nr:putative LRR receptor-like serine/threonine-protein kinase [Iris pallida]
MYILWILIDDFFFFSFLFFVAEGFSGVGPCSDWTVDCTYLFVSDVRVGYEVANLWLEHCWTCCSRVLFPVSDVRVGHQGDDVTF